MRKARIWVVALVITIAAVHPGCGGDAKAPGDGGGEPQDVECGDCDAGDGQQDVAPNPNGPLVVTTNSAAPALSGGLVEISVAGGGERLEAGIVWGVASGPMVGSARKNTAALRQGDWTFSMTAPADAFCTKFYVRGYGIEVGGKVTYGNELTFTTTSIITDCSPLNGTWGVGSSMQLQGRSHSFVIESVAPSASSSGWRNAYDKGLISMGTAWLNAIVPTEDGWACQVLWKTGTSSAGVTEVRYGAATLTLSADGKTLYLNSEDPWNPGSFGSGSLTKLSDELQTLPSTAP